MIDRPGRSEASRHYADFPGHPLAAVPQSTLDIARAVLAGAAQEHGVAPEMADPIADAVVTRLAEAGLLRNPGGGPVKAALDAVPSDIRVSANLTVAEEGPPSGLVYVPPGTAPEVVERLRARLPETVEVRVERRPS